MIVMDKLAQFPQIASRIIKEQELIIGPLAWIEAQKVSDIKIIDQKFLKGILTCMFYKIISLFHLFLIAS